MKKPASTTPPKVGPGEYIPDSPFARIEDLPKPKIIKEQRIEAERPCPRCGKPAARDHLFTRSLHDLGDLVWATLRVAHHVLAALLQDLS